MSTFLSSTIFELPAVIMKYILVVFLLVTLVSGQEEELTKITKELNELMQSVTDQAKNISKTLANNTMSTFGDISKFFKSKVSKREVVHLGSDLSTAKAELKRKCYIFGAPEDYHKVEVAIENFDSCITRVVNHIKEEMDGSTSATSVHCSHASAANSCFVDYTTALRPCLPHYKGGYFPFANISEAVINYLCVDEGAQERTDSFLENGISCIHSTLDKLEDCLNSTFPSGSYLKIEQNAYLFSEENCGKLAELRKCMTITILQACPPPVMRFLEGFKNVIEQFYTPCPEDRRTGN